MWKLAISQLRLHPRRYVAVLLAIVLGTMFLAGSLLVTSSAKETTKQMLGATYANADLMITAEIPPEPDSAFYELTGTHESSGTLQNVDGVAEVYPLMDTATAMVLPEDAEARGTLEPDADFVYAINRPDDASLLATPFPEGNLPESDREIALDTETAERHDLSVGDAVTIRNLADESEQAFQLSGVVDRSMDPTVVGTTTAYFTPDTLGQLSAQPPMYSMVLLRVDGDVDQVLTDVQQALDAAGISATVNTPDVQISEQLVDMLGFNAIAVVLGGFSAIALFVMMLVINNTFSVLVAQRTRQYALQRVLGATRSQIRKGVLAETLLIGLIGSIIGIGLAIALIFGIMTLAQRWLAGATFGMDFSVLWVLVAGVAITVAAAWLPASQAMRVSPLEAMRPVPEVTPQSKTGKFRIVVGTLMLLVGGVALIVSANLGMIGPAILAGAVSFIGVLSLGVLFVPTVVYWLGWLPRMTGVAGKMAQLNAVRQRSRTAATATALIVGTTLVALILTGGRTAQNSTDELLAENYPVDIYAELHDVDPTNTDDVESTSREVAQTSGIDAAEVLYPVGSIDEPWADEVMAADVQGAAEVSDGISDDDARALQEPGTVLVPQHYEADTLSVTTSDGVVDLDAVRSDLGSVTPVVSSETAEQLTVSPEGVAVLWLSVAEGVSDGDVQELLTTIVSDTELSAQDITSPLVMRSVIQQAIDAVMLTVIGLLGISVLIAFVGVANTLALSSLERTRENALMRALGLTRRGLRSMLTWEAVLISAVGAIVGSGLGMLYGWAGSVAIFGQVTSSAVTISWPVIEVIVVIVVAVVAGLVASVVPSRRAAKMSPVEGLAAE